MFHVLKEGFLLPHHCPICGKAMSGTGHTTCISCLAHIPYTRFASPSDNPMIRLLWPAAPMEQATCLFHYHPHSESGKLITAIKYRRHAQLAEQLGQMAALLKKEDWAESDIDGIVAVPIHWQKRAKRGYNQAAHLAKGIGRIYGLPVLHGMLKRKEHRVSQTRLQALERWTNAKHLYQARIPRKWKGKHVMIVDDVCTTGATLTACAEAMHAQDPTLRISCFTLALSGGNI